METAISRGFEEMSSVNQALALLQQLSLPPYEFTLGELAAAIGYSKSGTYKILIQLQKENYVQQQTNRKYALGCAVLKLHQAYENYSLNWNICRPILEQLRSVTGETCTLARWENGHAHILYRVRSPENLRVEGNVGRVLPMNASAHGKLLAAFQDEQIIDTLIKKYPLQKICPNTITDVEQLKAEYRNIRKEGVSISVEESSIGAIGIAAPVYGHDGRVVASLCVGTPSSRLTFEKREMVTKRVIASAQELSRIIREQAAAAR